MQEKSERENIAQRAYRTKDKKNKKSGKTFPFLPPNPEKDEIERGTRMRKSVV
jgi:hypothetical protein